MRICFLELNHDQKSLELFFQGGSNIIQIREDVEDLRYDLLIDELIQLHRAVKDAIRHWAEEEKPVKWYDLFSFSVGISLYLDEWRLIWGHAGAHPESGVREYQFGPLGIFVSWDMGRMIAAWELIKGWVR